MNKLKAMFIASKPFAIPIIVIDVSLGATLAGFQVGGGKTIIGFRLGTWLAGFAIPLLALTTTEFINNWRDYVRGFDTVEGGSVEKAYSMAPMLIPRGILSVKDMKIGAAVTLGLSLLLMFLVPRRLDVWLIYLLGVFVGATYTDLWKPNGAGEAAVFLGPGLLAIAFGYALVTPLDLTGLTAATIFGIRGPFFYTLDQYADAVSDHEKGIKVNLAYLLKLSPTRLSAYVWVSWSYISLLLIGAVVAGLIPKVLLSELILLPFARIVGIVMDNSYDTGMKLFVLLVALSTLVPLVALWLV